MFGVEMAFIIFNIENNYTAFKHLWKPDTYFSRLLDK